MRELVILLVQNVIQPSLIAEYVLSGDRHHFLIHKAKLNAKYTFSSYGPKGGHMSTNIV